MDDYNVVVNVSDDPCESLETSITKVRPYSSTCCIYRVPPRLRSVNETAYTSMLVSIGPLHHGNDKRLQMMEETKMRFVKNFIERPNVDLRECFNIVKDKKESLRKCYQETFGTEDDEFIKIVVVDAIFIVELLLTYYSQRLQPPVEIERVLDAKWVLNEVRQDLLLLENQLPFFIIEDVRKRATRTWINETFYTDFIIHMGLHLKENDGLEMIIKIIPKHFVDLLRNLYIPLKPRQPIGKAETFHAPSVTELHKAGVKFNVIESKSLLDISFSQGTLKISKWIITDRTEVLFRNLIALEQCHCAVDKAYICYYRRLMDNFANTSQDVNLLVENKIIENWLGDSNDVSSMINKLGFGVNISPSHFYFAEIFDGLNKHYEKNQCNRSMANIKQNYFNTPGAILYFCLALLLTLFLTMIQTV